MWCWWEHSCTTLLDLQNEIAIITLIWRKRNFIPLVELRTEFEQARIKMWYPTKQSWNLHKVKYRTSRKTFFCISIKVNELDNKKLTYSFRKTLIYHIKEDLGESCPKLLLLGPQNKNVGEKQSPLPPESSGEYYWFILKMNLFKLLLKKTFL